MRPKANVKQAVVVDAKKGGWCRFLPVQMRHRHQKVGVCAAAVPRLCFYRLMNRRYDSVSRIITAFFGGPEEAMLW